MKLLLLTLILLLAVLPAAAQTDAPYLYYFDRAESAFVIERADGTDRHFLAQGVMPAEVGSVAGPGWSPSGELLAWQGIIGRVQINQAIFLPYALNVETGQYLTQLDSFEETFVLDWHPSEDWLLAIGLADSSDDGFGRQIFRIALMDASNDTTIAAYSSEIFPGLLVTSHQWQSDGVIIPRPSTDVIEFLRLNKEGVTQIERRASTYGISPEGHLVYNFGNGGWAIEDINARHTALLEGEFTSLENIEWYGSRALIVDGGLWLLDAATNSITAIADEIGIPFGFRAGVNFKRLGNVEGMWSPDGARFAYMTPNRELLVSDGVTSDMLIDNVIDWGWSDGQTIVLALGESIMPVFMELSIDGENQSPEINDGRYSIWYSADQTHAAGFTDDGPWIRDLEADEFIQLPVHDSVEFPADYGGEIYWHEEWLIVKETPFVPMMGDDPALNSIVRIDGEMRRELPNCFVLCVEWLPEQVNIQNLPESD